MDRIYAIIWPRGKDNSYFNPETPSKIMSIGAIRCHLLNKDRKKKRKGEGKYENRKKTKLRTSNEEGEKNEEDLSKKLLDFRKQSVPFILFHICTALNLQNIFTLMAFHIKVLNQFIAILDIAQQNVLQKKLTDHRLL